MKCQNCRCIVPDNSDRCMYCGHIFPRGDDPTIPVVKRSYRSPATRYERYDYMTEYQREPLYTNHPSFLSTNSNYSRNKADYGTRYADNNGYYEYDYTDAHYSGVYGTTQNKENKQRQQIFDFAIINDEGTVDFVKSLIYFMAFDLAFMVILLLMFLASML